ncbi:flavin reductase family protein [Gracilibacillus suaedae]|uniref:flavin reductase family protein n=1 Tax=Gracilibacillus suaedae TaxID=2820273 RepID=UPI001ABE34EA|nr:flavin reductase family protein [Gracilibacillus suaedae]
MRTPVEEEIWYSYPGMVAVITARYKGAQNIMASGWHTYLGSNPGMYGISVQRKAYTYDLIEKSGVFGVHFLPAKYTELIQAVGTFSGSNVDKFQEYNIHYENGLKADIPILTSAYFAYECEVKSITPVADQEWIVGEVLQRYQDKDVFLDKGFPNLAKLDIPLHIGDSSYRILNDQALEKDHPF